MYPTNNRAKTIAQDTDDWRQHEDVSTNDSQYRLPPGEIERIFEEQIVPTLTPEECNCRLHQDKARDMTEPMVKRDGLTRDNGHVVEAGNKKIPEDDQSYDKQTAMALCPYCCPSKKPRFVVPSGSPCSLAIRIGTEQPLAVLVGGQPGAGKTTLTTDVLAEIHRLNERHAVVIDIDNYRRFHPKFLEIQEMQGVLSGKFTNHEAWEWQSRAIAYCAAHRESMVVHLSMWNEEGLRHIISALRIAGYYVDMRVLAVPLIESWQSTAYRYEKQLARGEVPRAIPWEDYERRGRALLSTLDVVESEALVDALTIYSRFGDTLFVNTLAVDSDGCSQRWRWPLGAVEALEEERNRRPEEAYAAQLHERWNVILDMMRQRGASNEEIDAARRQQNSNAKYLENRLE